MVSYQLKDKGDLVNVQKVSEHVNVSKVFNFDDDIWFKIFDILISEDLIKVFFMIGDDITENRMIKIDFNKKSQFGFKYITVYSEIQENLPEKLNDYKYFSAKLEESIRPAPEGDRKCQIMKPPSTAKYFSGFLPKITGMVYIYLQKQTINKH